MTVSGSVLMLLAPTLAAALGFALFRLRAARRQLAGLGATIPGALFRSVGGWERGRLVDLGEAIAAIAGVSASELLKARSFAHLVHPDDAERVARAHQAAAEQDASYMLEFRVVRPDGTLRWVLESARASGRGFEFQGMLLDITERKLAEERADEASATSGRLKKDFLAMVSHEFRTPLTSILGFTELLETSDLDGEQLGYVRAIHDSGEILLALINDLLDFSRIEAGKLTLEMAPFWITPAVEEVASILRVEAQRKGIELSIASEGEHAALADPARVRQILLNLIGNAIKFSPAEVPVSIKISQIDGGGQDEGQVEVSVSDKGSGISSAIAPSIFQPFFQGEASASRRYGGSGLGLALSKHLVEMMGGRIGFESEPDRETRFWFTLPKSQETPPRVERAPKPVKPAPKPRRPSRRTSSEARANAPAVLLAEDNPTNALLVSHMLRKLGCRVDLAMNGDEAVRLATERSYAFVLMDCQMPGVDGYDATRQIRTREVKRRTPIVALTANATPNDREACQRAGMDEYLRKPVRKDELRRIIERFT